MKNEKTKGYLSWFHERFPPLNILSAFLLFYFMYAYINTFKLGIEFGAKELLLPVGILAQLLLLRVLDEFKDNEFDKIHHPERTLQKGQLNVGDLKIIGVVCLTVQVALNVIYSTPFNMFWMAMSGWTFLMYKEFFIGEWLKRHIFLYLISHMTVMPLMCFWMFSFYPVKLMAVIPAVSVVLLGSLLYELCRKTRGTDESESLDSYPQEIGYLFNSFLLVALSLGVFSLSVYCGVSSVWFLAVGALSLILFLATTYSHHRKKKLKSRKKLEAVYGLYMLTIYLGFIVGVFV